MHFLVTRCDVRGGASLSLTRGAGPGSPAAQSTVGCAVKRAWLRSRGRSIVSMDQCTQAILAHDPARCPRRQCGLAARRSLLQPVVCVGRENSIVTAGTESRRGRRRCLARETEHRDRLLPEGDPRTVQSNPYHRRADRLASGGAGILVDEAVEPLPAHDRPALWDRLGVGCRKSIRTQRRSIQAESIRRRPCCCRAAKVHVGYAARSWSSTAIGSPITCQLASLVLRKVFAANDDDLLELRAESPQPAQRWRRLSGRSPARSNPGAS